MTRVIRFECQQMLDLSPREIVDQILELENWTNFRGYGFIPGIQKADFDKQTPDVVGTRIRVLNADGSSHVEEVTAYVPNQSLQLSFAEFSPPLSHLAKAFQEIWSFEPTNEGTWVRRSFVVEPKSWITRPPLRFISIFLKRAISRHLAQMSQDSRSPEERRRLEL